MEDGNARTSALVRQLFESGLDRVGLGPRVRFDIAEHDIQTASAFLLRLMQHGVRLADAGAHTEENLEPPAPRLSLGGLSAGEKSVRIGALVRHNTDLKNAAEMGGP